MTSALGNAAEVLEKLDDWLPDEVAFKYLAFQPARELRRAIPLDEESLVIRKR